MSKKTIISTAIRTNPTTQGNYETLLAEQISKKLFAEKRPISLKELGKLLETNKIYASVDDLRKAILLLKSNNFIPRKCTSSFYLTAHGEKETQKKNQKYNDTLQRIITKYYTQGIHTDQSTVSNWLEQVLKVIYQQYYRVVLSRLTNSEKIDVEHLEIDTLHQKIAKQYEFSPEETTILRGQLKNMLTAENDPDVNYLTYYFLNSCYAAQILTTKTYTPISLAEVFLGKTIILDTNVLIALQLEKKNQKHVNFLIIDDVCKKLNIKLKYIEQTQTEYSKVVTHKKETYSDFFAGISDTVRNKTRFDNILYTLKVNGCYNPTSVRSFFDKNIICPPTSLGNDMASIECIPNEDTYASFEYYRKIEAHKDQLRNIFSSSNFDDFEQDEIDTQQTEKCIKRRDGVVEHDLGLIGYVRTERGTGDFAIEHNKERNDDVILLTMDTSLITYVKEQYPNEKFAYNLRDIITLLALDKGGLLGNPEDFSPMLSSFVDNHFIIWEDTFDIKDLTLIMNLERQVGTLNDEKVIQISQELHKMRLRNASKSDIHKFLQGELNFEFNKVNTENQKLIDKTTEQEGIIKRQQEELIKLKEDAQKRRKKDLDDEIDQEIQTRRKQSRRGRWKNIGIFVLLCILTVVIYILIPQLSKYEEINKCLFEINGFEISWKRIISGIAILIPLVIDALWCWFRIIANKDILSKEYYSRSKAEEAVMNRKKLSQEIDSYIQNGQ